jgi:hypothetical protein
LKISINAFTSEVQEGEGNDRYVPYLDYVHTNNILSKFSLNPHMPMSRGRMAHLVHKLLLDREDIVPLSGVRENYSLGCEVPTPSTPPTTSVVHGVTRSYLTTIGRDYTRNQPTPLIIAFH